MNVEEKCHCGFSLLNILNPRFFCFVESGNTVTYRTELIATGVATLADIATHIQEWITEGAQISFDSVLITIDSTCQVVVTSVMEDECGNPTSTLPSTFSITNTPTSTLPNTTEDTVLGTTLALIGTTDVTVRAVIGGVVGAVSILGAVVLVTIVTLSCWMHRKRKHMLNIR